MTSGIERALRQEIDVAETRRLFLEHADERRADAPALLLGVDHAGERVEELVGRVDVHQADVSLGAHHVDHAVALATRSSPLSTKTQVSWSPTARCTSVAATAESTPPLSAQITLPSPIWLRSASMVVSMNEPPARCPRTRRRR